MSEKVTPRVSRSFSISVGDLVFSVSPNKLIITHPTIGTSLETTIRKEEMDILSAFCEKASEILAPVPGTRIVYSTEAGPQKITLLIDERENYVLVINDQIQFTTQSEEIYHEALVCPAVASREQHSQSFLILGGGDGLVAKQIFKHNPDANVVLVDFDPNITQLFTHDPVMKKFNENSMQRCLVVNADAYEFVQNHDDQYDVIICDFPDPDDEIFNKLYSVEFYEMVKKLLKPNGSMAVQSGSLAAESKCFQCIAKTIQAVGFFTKTYYTPTSYGELVYTLARLDGEPKVVFAGTNRQYKTISQEYFDTAMSVFRPGSYSTEEVEVNTVKNNIAVEYRLAELKLVGG